MIVLEVIGARLGLVVVQRLGDAEGSLVVAQLLGDEIADVLLDLEGQVLEHRVAQALAAVGHGAVLHPGAQAPPLGTGGAHLGRQIGVPQFLPVDVGRRVPGQFPRLQAKLPDLGVVRLGDHRIRVRIVDDLFEHR